MKKCILLISIIFGLLSCTSNTNNYIVGNWTTKTGNIFIFEKTKNYKILRTANCTYIVQKGQYEILNNEIILINDENPDYPDIYILKIIDYKHCILNNNIEIQRM